MGLKVGNIEVYGVIYKITNKVNGKVYIGQTINKRGFNGRYNNYGKGVTRVYNYYKFNKEHNRFVNNHLANAINKYGVNSFDVIEIFDVAFSKEELDIKEKCWINIYDSTKNGYNNREGGSNGRFSEESKDKIRKNKIGTKLTEVQKDRISKRVSGKGNPMYGKHHNEETRKKISDANKKYNENNIHNRLGTQLSEQTKNKLSESHKGKNKGKNNGKSKSIILLFINKTYIIFDTVSEASKWLVENNYQKTFNGAKDFIYRYLKSKKVYNNLFKIKYYNDKEM